MVGENCKNARLILCDVKPHLQANKHDSDSDEADKFLGESKCNAVFVTFARCDPEGLPWCRPGTVCHWQQNPEDPEVQGSGP